VDPDFCGSGIFGQIRNSMVFILIRNSTLNLKLNHTDLNNVSDTGSGAFLPPWNRYEFSGSLVL
jgi:hypothetical protein